MGYTAVGEFPVLSLSLPSSEDNISVIDAQPISYSLPRYSSSSTTTCDSGEDGNSPFFCLSLFPEFTQKIPSKPILSLFPQVSGNTSKPTLSFFPQISKSPLSLFPQFSENLAASKPIGKNTPTTTNTLSSPSIDLCLSLPYTPDTTITTLHRSVGSSQHSSAKRSLFRETGDEKFVPAKKIKVRKHSTPNNSKRPQAVVPVAAATGEGEEEGHWIVKPLTKSDVNGASRLLLGRQDVKNYVLPFMKEEEQAVICNELRGVDVKVYDMDTQTVHILNLRKWATNSFQLVKAWTSEFVKRRNLKEDDVIWIRWDKNYYRFCFRVHMRNGVFAV
ncbi:hypothetical protein P3S67_032661 [Capsicum chacoense]